MSAPENEKTEAETWIRRWGTNCNSFLSLYPGFRWFCPPELGLEGGGIAFIESGKVFVGAGDPCVSPEDLPRFLRLFSEFAQKQGKSVALIPVSENTAAIARELGYGSVTIGSEPTFDMSLYPFGVAPDSWDQIVYSARALKTRGAVVEEFRPENIKQEVFNELDAIKKEWLESRKMAPLGFLNRVEPWALARHKKYFWVRMGDKTLAYVAAVPIWAKNGWYLIDVLRSQKTPAGTVELLLLESMRLLKKDGAEHISLGVAPLARLSAAKDRQGRGRLYAVLEFVYESLDHFYNFKSLHDFKEKFKPTHYEPAVLIYSPSKLGLSQAKGLLEAFTPGGLNNAAISFASKSLSKIDLLNLIHQMFRLNVVTLGRPQARLSALLGRLKATLFLLAALAAIFYGLPKEALRPDFSGAALLEHPLKAILLPQFFHSSRLHLWSNAAMILVFMGAVEYSFGSLFALGAFFVASMLANPITLFAFSLAKVFSGALWSGLFASTDVGASLGAFGCLGVLCRFSKRKKWLLALSVLASAAACLVSGNLLEMNHLIALAIGYVFASMTM